MPVTDVSLDLPELAEVASAESRSEFAFAAAV